jgi:UDP-N-acetylmuramyl pentapeptide synthase
MSARCRCDRAFRTVGELAAHAADVFAPGDTVLLKASNGLRLGAVVDAV